MSGALICLLLVLSMVFSMVPLTFAVPSETEIITPATGDRLLWRKARMGIS